ncbi:MAG: cytoplasmic protein [Tindallia sp. MSAO_Bac2]|nr:MAG: cytoplasmic protein [Tindallia sp. MSAO_Bac2]
MEKAVFFAFKGDTMCFIHVLLNAMDMKEKGNEALIVMEGEAVRLIKELEESNNQTYRKAKDMGLFKSICKACSAKMGVLNYNEKSGIPLDGEMNGHPAMEPYISQGYQIITL